MPFPRHNRLTPPHHLRAPGEAMPRPRAAGAKAGHQTGFTLFELLVALAIAVLASIAASSKSSDSFTAEQRSYAKTQALTNLALRNVLLDYASTVSATGSLPTPYSNGTTIKYAITDGSNAPLQALLVQANIRPGEAISDGSPADNVRVYQIASPLTFTAPLYGTNGPSVTLTYAEAAIYSTNCQRSLTCNTTGTAGVPGSTGQLSTTNLSTFALAGTDFGLQRFSNLAIQKQKLARTADNIEMITTHLREYFVEKQRLAAATDTTNFYPRPSAPAASAMGTTADCHNDGWYRLDNSDVLTQVSLQPTVHGMTAWGGNIQYCPDYDASGVQAADAPPHYAALRILASPSNGGSATNATTNIIIPFY